MRHERLCEMEIHTWGIRWEMKPLVYHTDTIQVAIMKIHGNEVEAKD